MTIHRRQRRGALLLICLVLLVLFLMLGITFVLTATSFRKGQASNLRSKEFEDRSEDILDKVLLELLRGSTNPRSPFRGHSLLGDVYGRIALKGRIQVVTDSNPVDDVDDQIVAAGGQFMKLKVDVDEPYKPLRNFEDYYAGLVLTMVTGPAKGQSTRIVEFDPPDRFVVMAFNGRDADGNRTYPKDGDRILVNGRPFTGTGQGYHPESADFNTYSQIDVQPSWKSDYALLPNLSFFEPNGGIIGQIPDQLKYSSPVGPGDQNEDYDAADFNNPWLAAVTGQGIKPSFHDPQLIHFWLEWAKLDPDLDITSPDSLDFQSIYRKISFRPIPADHPRFTGSNPDFNWATGPWDVDNDGDGNRDSIWMDVGLPVQTLPDGRIVKPLVAMLVQDMDGRVNINVHGSTDLANATDPVSGPLAGGSASAPMPRGSGVTPSEVDLRWALVALDANGNLADTSTVGEVYANLLNGTTQAGPNADESFQGRYGETPGGNNGPGVTGVNDTYSRIAATHLFGGFQAFFGFPSDIRGIGAVAVDHRGQGMTGFMGNVTDFTDEPGEMLLGPRAIANPFDRPFTPAEFERILRHSDVDASALPRRLLWLSTVNDDNGALQRVLVSNRHAVTHGSWDFPVYSPAIFHGNNLKSQRRKFATQYPRQVIPRHIIDLFIARVIQTQANPNAGAAETVVQNLIDNDCIAPEMLAGLKFNINRLFGNGQDDNDENTPGYGTVDEPAESGDELLYGELGGNNDVADVAEANQAGQAALRHPFDSVKLDFNRSGDISPHVGPNANAAARYAAYHGTGGDYSVRQDYARQLYCMMLAVIDEPAVIEHYGANSDDQQQVSEARALFARHVAQYAINVVDFRDADAIMTPFLYDVDPFTGGWNATERVWGCETPVASLSESLALHDRGLKDAVKDAKPVAGMAGSWEETSPDDHNFPVDPHFDQDRVPRGSTFFEVYCVANPHRPGHTAELFSDGKLDLARMDNNGNGNKPVWRIAISKAHEVNQTVADLVADPITRKRLVMDPDFVGVRQSAGNQQAIEIEPERYVWFTTTIPTNDADETYYNQSSSDDDPNAKLLPGEYVVVGPRKYTIISHLSDTDLVNRQMIILDPQVAQRVRVTDGDRSSDYPSIGNQVKSPKAIICKTKPVDVNWASPQSLGLNISEPLPDNYYPSPDIAATVQDQDPATQLIPDGSRYRRMVSTTDANGDPQDEQVPLDFPLDRLGGMARETQGAQDSPVALIQNWDGQGQDDGNDTKMNYRTAFLQRLANPMLPHDPVHNPYMIVDWIPLDLTVYNREETRPGSVELRSRERGRALLAATQPADKYARNLWFPALVDPQGGGTPPASHQFAADLIHSLGFLNRSFSDNPNVTVGNIGNADWFSTEGGAYVGDPKTPFPWIAWNDRPFVSQFELMQVPSASSGLLGLEFTSVHSANVGSSPTNLNPYNTFKNTGANGEPIIAFGHLMNFFHSLKPAENPGIQMGRVFDFLHVPSYYSNSHTALNATDLTGEDGVDPRTGGADLDFDEKENFAPPYNYISNYREPGRVNLNTIYDPRVWWALMHGRKNPATGAHLENQRHAGPSWEAFVRHRRGYNSGSSAQATILALEDPNMQAAQQSDFYPVNAPSYFCLPYRSQGNYDLHPFINYRDLDNGIVVETVDFTSVDASLLRRHVLANDFSVNQGADFPLFRDAHNAYQDATPKFYADASANSYFKYQPINRLGNLTTTRSNVYAVWMTVGYFEVSTAPRWGTTNAVNDFVYPDGYQIGRELGEDTGDVKRHRAFYMIDRTIPVGYENGHDHNVENAIRLRRQIE